MGYCKHRWQETTEVLREVFHQDADRKSHEFFVCARCLRIEEVRPEPAQRPLRADEAA